MTTAKTSVAVNPTSSKNRPVRSQLKTLVAFVEHETSDTLRHQAIDEKTTIQALTEASVLHFSALIKKRDAAALKLLRDVTAKRKMTPGPKPKALQPA